MKLMLIAIFGIFLTASVITKAVAQSDSSQTKLPLSFELGLGTNAALADDSSALTMSFGIAVQYHMTHHWFMGICYLGSGGYYGGKPNETVQIYGTQAGYIFDPSSESESSRFQILLSTGPCWTNVTRRRYIGEYSDSNQVIVRTYTTYRADGADLHSEVKIQIVNPSSRLGFGIAFYDDLNSFYNNDGLLFTLTFQP